MLTIEELINQVGMVLIETNDSLSPHQIYSRFVNECNELNLGEADFYKIILKPAHKSINWETVEEANKQQEETENKIKTDQKEKAEAIKNAPAYIEVLVKQIFETGIIKINSLQSIFNKAENLKQDSNTLALHIHEKLEANNFKAHPGADLEADTLKQILLSTDWYSPAHFPRPVKPVKGVKQTSPKMIGLVILSVFILVTFVYLVQTRSNIPTVHADLPIQTVVTDTVKVVQPPPTVINPVDTTVVRQEDTPPGTQTSTELSNEERQDISNLLNGLYTAENNEEIGSMLEYFEFPIERYYNSYSIDSDSLSAMFNTSFNKKLLRHSITVDWNETTVTKTATGYVVIAKAIYKKVLQKEPDAEKTMDIRINIKMNADKKITTIYAG